MSVDTHHLVLFRFRVCCCLYKYQVISTPCMRIYVFQKNPR